MLFMAGEPNCTPVDLPNLLIFNFSSFIEVIPRWEILPPPMLVQTNGFNLDMEYLHYLIDDDLAFYTFFTVLYHWYLGNNIYILISQNASDFLDAMNESLFKIIQQRYGISTFILNDPFDYLELDESMCGMNVHTVGTFDKDKARYTRMSVENDIRTKTREQVEFEYGLR